MAKKRQTSKFGVPGTKDHDLRSIRSKLNFGHPFTAADCATARKWFASFNRAEQSLIQLRCRGAQRPPARRQLTEAEINEMDRRQRASARREQVVDPAFLYRALPATKGGAVGQRLLNWWFH